MKTRKRYSAQFKADVVLELLKEEKTLSELASEHGVHPNQLREWRKVALEGLPQVFERGGQQQQAERAAYEQQIDSLYTEIGRLSSQLNWLQKNLATTVGRAERRAMVEYEERTLPLSVQAELLGVSRASLYYQPVAPSPEEVALKHRIDEIYTAHPFYGSRRITAQLRREGQVINRKHLQRHMREMGIEAIYPGPNLSKRHQEHQVYPYLLRGLTIDAPDLVWGIDIPYIRLRAGWLYLVAVLDWFSRYVVSWALDDTLEMAFVLDAVERALAQATPTIWNSDQGGHFTSPHYLDRLHQAGVRISMDGKGRALDNIFTERLWRTIKYEEVYLHDYQSPRQARHHLTDYLSFYHEQRPHQALAYRTPAEVYFAA